MLPKNSSPVPQNSPVDIRMEFIGGSSGTRTFQTGGRQYRGGNNTFSRFVTVPRQFPQDAEYLVATGMFRIVPTPHPEIPPRPIPASPIQDAKKVESKVTQPKPQPEPQPQAVAAAPAAAVTEPTLPPADASDHMRQRPTNIRDLRKALKEATLNELMQWAYEERTMVEPRSSYVKTIEAEIDKR